MASGGQNPWADLSKQLSSAIPKLNTLLEKDAEYQAFSDTPEISEGFTFAIKAAGSDNSVIFTVSNNKTAAVKGSYSGALFTLSALPEQWEQFFEPMPVAPYQSYWGMLIMNTREDGVEVLGDKLAFSRFAHFWRRGLELLHDAHCGPMTIDQEEELNEDFISGRYVHIEAPIWGRCKVFYEQSGEGKQDILFLHTAGTDSRQYHGVMNNEQMRKLCNMFAFDLPDHGRSFPSHNELPGAHTVTEDSYVGAIAAIVKKLKLNKPIICGASMAGQVCLAVAIRAEEVGAGGTIPLQGSDYLNTERNFHTRTTQVNQSLYNPELVYGMMCPTAPLKNRRLIWHMYSASAYGIFHGDLDFYFGGWDGRSRVGNIDCNKCPVYMLTGDYDWSTTPAMSQQTCDKISGARFQVMKQLGHFPATENPARFVPYLVEAIEWIQKTRRGSY